MKLFSMLCGKCHFTPVLGIYVSQTPIVLAHEEVA
jgi:hypothetical protein